MMHLAIENRSKLVGVACIYNEVGQRNFGRFTFWPFEVRIVQRNKLLNMRYESEGKDNSMWFEEFAERHMEETCEILSPTTAYVVREHWLRIHFRMLVQKQAQNKQL